MSSEMNQNFTHPPPTFDTGYEIVSLNNLEVLIGSTAFVYQGSLYMIIGQILYFVDTKG